MSDEQQHQKPTEPTEPPQHQEPFNPVHPDPAAATGLPTDQAPQPQWVPAAPPHPYGSGQPGDPAPRPGGGKAIAVASMSVGLVALLTICVSVAYFNSASAVASGVLGIVAVSLGVVALVKKFRPTGAGITGVATGALSMVAVTALLGAGALAAPQKDSDEAQQGEAWQPGTEQESLLEWPANMISGGIVFEGPGDPRPKPSDPLQAGTAPQSNHIDRESGNDILVYVDYRCPHCMEFEQQNGDYLTELIDAGETTVEFVPLSFMDRMSDGSYYSSRAAGAVACFVNSQPESTWDAHQALLSPEVQPGAGKGLDNEHLLSAFERHVGDIDPAVRECILGERFVPFAQGLNEWVFQNPVPNTSASNVRVEGTPMILVNGLVYPGDPSDPAAFKAFFEEQAN